LDFFYIKTAPQEYFYPVVLLFVTYYRNYPYSLLCRYIRLSTYKFLFHQTNDKYVKPSVFTQISSFPIGKSYIRYGEQPFLKKNCIDYGEFSVAIGITTITPYEHHQIAIYRQFCYKQKSVNLPVEKEIDTYYPF